MIEYVKEERAGYFECDSCSDVLELFDMSLKKCKEHLKQKGWKVTKDKLLCKKCNKEQ